MDIPTNASSTTNRRRESCGYNMLPNINKVCEQQEIQAIDKEETALEGYMIEITKNDAGKAAR